LRNTVIIPENCRATILAFSIRSLASAHSYIVTLWVNGVSSGLSATIVDGSVTTAVAGSGSINLSALDLISMKLTYSGGNGALANGLCVTLMTTKP
jgi:hypothetical protein